MLSELSNIVMPAKTGIRHLSPAGGSIPLPDPRLRGGDKAGTALCMMRMADGNRQRVGFVGADLAAFGPTPCTL